MSDYLVGLEPGAHGDCKQMYLCKENRVQDIINYVKQRNNTGSTIIIAKIVEKAIANVDVKYHHYTINDAGEVLPK